MEAAIERYQVFVPVAPAGPASALMPRVLACSVFHESSEPLARSPLNTEPVCALAIPIVSFIKSLCRAAICARMLVGAPNRIGYSASKMANSLESRSATV